MEYFIKNYYSKLIFIIKFFSLLKTLLKILKILKIAKMNDIIHKSLISARVPAAARLEPYQAFQDLTGRGKMESLLCRGGMGDF